MKFACVHLICLAALGLHFAPAAFAQLNVMTSGGFAAPYEKLLPVFEKRSGIKVTTTRGASQGDGPTTIPAQLRRGVAADVVIMSKEGLKPLVAEGRIVAGSVVDLAQARLGVAVREGAPKPDISSPKALKQALLAAKTIAFVDPPQGSDGTTTKTALEKLGVYDAITPKAKLFPNSGNVGNTIAKGDADICIYWLNEMTNPGVDVVGRLPKQILSPLKVMAFVSTHAKDPKAAKALLSYLSSPEVEAMYKEDGLLPAH